MTLLCTLTLTVFCRRILVSFSFFCCCCCLYFSDTVCPLYDVALWTDGSFLFSFLAKVALAYLPTALSMALRPLFPFQQAEYAQVFRLRLAPPCYLFAGLGSTNKSATFLLLLSDSRFVSPPCLLLHLAFYLNLSGRSGRNFLLSPPVLSGENKCPGTQATMGPRTFVSPG